MRPLPAADPGVPDLRSPLRFLLRVGRLQRGTLAGGAVFGVLWMGGQALVPFVLGRAIDQGVAGRDSSALLHWALLLVGIGTVQTFAGVSRHRFAVANYLTAAFRTTQWVNAHVLRLGAGLRARTSAGEVVSVGATDTIAVARALDITARGTGALVAFVLVTVLLLASSLTLGLVVVVGVPLFSLAIGPLLRPLHDQQAAARAALGQLTTLGTDTVAGLRVLRGIGGEQAFLTRYAAQSQQVRQAGRRVARTQALLDAAQVLLPGTFVVIVTWLGARFAVEGRISVGDLIAFYGYAAFLTTPLRTLTEATDKITRALVACARLVTLLQHQPVLADDGTADEPVAASALIDVRSGLQLRPGVLTALVSGDPGASSQLAERLARYVDDGDVRLGAVPLTDLPLAVVRRRVLLVDSATQLFRGAVRDEIGGTAEALDRAVQTACAQDVLDALPDGLDSILDERGSQLSGGQRQRLILARALATDPEVLVLDEPTSAVDAHTEARIAARLSEARRGRTTLVLTTSPLLLDRVDEIALLAGGSIVATGTHAELLTHPAYRSVVLRDIATASP